jgi:glycosyltransferase involved in cell wall biosynthesis
VIHLPDGKEYPDLPNCLIVIPAHDEAEDIGDVIAEINECCDYPVVVVDDASTDTTAERARAAGATVIPLVVQLGAWGAIQTGLRYAWRHGYSHVITMDADGQHQPESLPCTQRGSLLRKVAWKLMRAVSGLRLEDLTSGFRVYDRMAIRRLAGWQATLLEYQDVGVLAMLNASGLRIMDVEVEMLPRRHGISRVFHSWASVIYYMSYTLLLGFTKRGMTHRDPA